MKNFYFSFNVGLSLSKKTFYLLHWKPFKMMKNAFYFILKVFFVLKIFKYLSWLLGLDYKIRLLYGVTTWLTNNCNTRIANISRSKGNQTIIFVQLIEFNKRNIFFKNHATSFRPLVLFFWRSFIYHKREQVVCNLACKIKNCIKL